MQQENLKKYNIFFCVENCGKTIFYLMFWFRNQHHYKKIRLGDDRLNFMLLYQYYINGNIVAIHKSLEPIIANRDDCNCIFMDVENKLSSFTLKMTHDFLVLLGNHLTNSKVGDIRESGIIEWNRNLNIDIFLNPDFIFNRINVNLFSYYYTKHVLKKNEIPYKRWCVTDYEPGTIITSQSLRDELGIGENVPDYHGEITKNNADDVTPEGYIELIEKYSQEFASRKLTLNLSDLQDHYDRTIERLEKMGICIEE